VLIYPEKKTSVVYRAKNSIFGYFAWPSICRDEEGTLYAVASGFRMQHICPFGKTVMFISRDEGRIWSPPIVINDSILDDRDAGILHLGGGRLLVTWFSHPAHVYINRYYNSMKNSAKRHEAGALLGMLAAYPYIPAEEAAGGSFVMISEDRGMSWSEPIKVPVSAPHGPNICRDGTLIYLGKPMYSDEEPDEGIVAWASTDGGYTWSRRGYVPLPEGYQWSNFHEPHVLELPDRSLLGAIRAQKLPHKPEMSIFTCSSTNGGMSWSTPECIMVSGLPPHLLLHSSGAVICSFARREPPYGERAVISYDNGRSWTDEYVITDDSQDWDIGYPATVELSDGSLLTAYYQRLKDDTKCSIVSSVWRLNKH